MKSSDIWVILRVNAEICILWKVVNCQIYAQLETFWIIDVFVQSSDEHSKLKFYLIPIGRLSKAGFMLLIKRNRWLERLSMRKEKLFHSFGPYCNWTFWKLRSSEYFLTFFSKHSNQKQLLFFDNLAQTPLITLLGLTSKEFCIQKNWIHSKYFKWKNYSKTVNISGRLHLGNFKFLVLNLV